MNLRRDPEILALAILLLLLAFVVPGDLNIARASIASHSVAPQFEIPVVRAPQPPPPPVVWPNGAELI